MKTTSFKWIICLLALLTPLGSYADEGIEGPTWYDYRDTSLDVTSKGTFDDPIVITTPEQLAQVAYLVNETGNKFEGKVIVLGADINLKKEVDGKRVQWVPIGLSEETFFKGFFLGVDASKLTSGSQWTSAMSHTISGMYINAISSGTYTTFYYGLFGHSVGFIGYLRMTESEIVYGSDDSAYDRYVGLLCGRTYRFIYNVSVEGNINIDTTCRKVFAGGIAGYVGGEGYDRVEGGIAHSTFKGQMNVNANICVGGICGETYQCHITDCAADVSIKMTRAVYDQESFTGGIAGYICGDATINACFTSGTISGMNVGGICGISSNGHSLVDNGTAYITSCASSCALQGSERVGGILGVAASQPITHVFRCVFNGQIKGVDSAKAGGIAGRIPEVKDELISRCLMLGSIEPAKGKSAKTGAIAGEAPFSAQTIANCYYDRQLFEGKPVGETERHVTIKGLTTSELITGLAKDLPLLDIDEAEQSKFTLRKGYYPAVYSDEAWQSISLLEKPAGDSEWIGKMFDKDKVDQSNTVYRYGAWLCSVPAIMPKGDAALDMVTQVSVPAKNGQWTEGERNVSVESTVTFPETVEFLKIDGKTAKVVGNGEFDVIVGSKLTKKIDHADLFNRPAMMMVSKKIRFVATPDQVWDGSVAEAYAAGTGVREDPYLIKNGAQLARAVLENKEGECFKMLCNINLNTDMFDDEGKVNTNDKKDWLFVVDNKPRSTTWNATFDGSGHFIRGLYLANEGQALFGHVGTNGSISNLALVESTYLKGGSGLLATDMDGKISSCLVHGTLRPTAVSALQQKGDHGILRGGGIAVTVGPNNPEAVIEDCISAVANLHAFSDYTPFVSLSDNNRGTVRNCLSVVPVFYANSDWSRCNNSAAGHSYIQDCYWLKGYETNTDGGSYFKDINEALGQRERWQATANYFPTLKTFAETDIAKLLMVPLRTEVDGVQSLDGFTRQLEFEPGSAQWANVGANYWDSFSVDSDMGLIVPNTGYDSSDAKPEDRSVIGMALLRGKLGKETIFLPMRTSSASGSLRRGINFEDYYAKQLCMRAFDTDRDGMVSLSEVRAVTPEQFATAFQSDLAKWIRNFPEFRFFKGITKLTNQLNNMAEVESLRLPFALTEIGTNAFSGCYNLKEVTLPAKVSDVGPHPFYNSRVSNINVDPFNQNLKSRDGVLFDANNGLIAYPNGRSGEEITISGVVTAICEGAIYRIEGLKRLYLDFDNFDRPIPELEYGGIETTDGSLIEVYAKDGSEEREVIDGMLDDPSWSDYSSANKLFRYYPINIDDSHAATFYLGFDVQLPEELTPYIVSTTIPAENALLLEEMERKVPKLSPVVVMAPKAGVYRLLPLEGEQLEPWKMYRNRLNGSGSDGIPVYAEDSGEGGIYSLQRHSQYGVAYFDYFKEEMFPPCHAYLPYNSIADDLPMGVHFLLAQEVTVGDWQAYAIPELNEGSAGSLAYTGVMSDYDGSEHNVVVPTTLTSSVLGGEPTEIKINALSSNLFAEPKAEIWNVDCTKFTETLKGFDKASGRITGDIHVNRPEEGNPFYGLNHRAYIYLNGGTIDDNELNVVLNGYCVWFELMPGRDFVPPSDFTAGIANYSDQLQPQRGEDGSESSKAYTVMLPFRKELQSNAGLFTLKSIDQLNHHFVFTPVEDNVIEPGKPYVIVVNSGVASLKAEDVTVTAATHRDDVMSWENVDEARSQCGYWEGTYATLDNATSASNTAYVMQADGTFQRIREKHDETVVQPYRAYFTSGGNYSAIDPGTYTMVMARENDLYAQNPYPFPANAYTSDADMSGYDVPASAIWCAENSTLYFTAEDGYEVGDRYGDDYTTTTITNVWTGDQLLNLGKDNPDWLSSDAVNAVRVVFKDNFASVRPKSLHAWFKGMENLEQVQGLEYLNTSETKDMSQMFQGCSRIGMLDLSSFSVDVDDASQMFQGCISLTTIFTESRWNIHYEGDQEMFDDCFNLIGARTYSEGYTDGEWADNVVGYFTPTPYAIWCAEDATLFFAAPNNKIEPSEEKWEGKTITAMWKGIDVGSSDVNYPAWGEDAKAARRVIFDDSFARQRPHSLTRWFYNFTSLQLIDGLEYLNTSQTEEADYMFAGCAFSEIDVNSFDTSKMRKANRMFRNCADLRTIWCDNTWNIASTTSMFEGCNNLQGAVQFSSANVDGTMANPTTGYFTATPVLELKDKQEDYTELFKQYDGKRVHIRYDRQFAATRNDDGTWKRKAYTVCLPYYKTLYAENSRGLVSLYTLASVTDDGNFIFAEYGQAELEAGQPYILVVNEGEISLNADNVFIDANLDEGTPVFATFDDWFDQNFDKQVGWWKGIYTRIYAEDVEPQQLYGMQATDGRWLRYRDFKKGYHQYWLTPLRAIYQSIEPTGINTYHPLYGYIPAGEEGARQILTFPSDEFDGDDIDDEHIGIDFIRETGDAPTRYYDLLGRPLGSKPTKGLYIEVQNGKKVSKNARK